VGKGRISGGTFFRDLFWRGHPEFFGRFTEPAILHRKLPRHAGAVKGCSLHQKKAIFHGDMRSFCDSISVAIKSLVILNQITKS